MIEYSQSVALCNLNGANIMGVPIRKWTYFTHMNFNIPLTVATHHIGRRVYTPTTLVYPINRPQDANDDMLRRSLRRRSIRTEYLT